jgi:hypothetical protein
MAPPVGVDDRQSISTGCHEENGICLVRVVCVGRDDENGFCQLLTFGYFFCEGKISFFNSVNLYRLVSLARTLCFRVPKYVKTL